MRKRRIFFPASCFFSANSFFPAYSALPLLLIHPLAMPFPFFYDRTSSSLPGFILIFIFSTCFYLSLFEPCCIPTLERASAWNMSFKNTSPSAKNRTWSTTKAGRQLKKTKRFVSMDSPTLDKQSHKHNKVQNLHKFHKNVATFNDRHIFTN